MLKYLLHFLEISQLFIAPNRIFLLLLEEDRVGFICIVDLDEQILEILLLHAESESHREQILEFAKQVVNQNNEFDEHLAVSVNLHSFGFLLGRKSFNDIFSLIFNHHLFLFSQTL